MKNKFFDFIILISALISLIIECAVFINVGIFVDEYNLSPDIVLGSNMLVNMEWLMLLLLFVICFLSIIRLIKNK